MAHDVWLNLGWAVVFAVVGGITGVALIFVVAMFLPRLMDKVTPTINEQQEIARGNRAVAEYFGRVVSAVIIGASIIIAAAVLGGIIAALY